mmetsp:Transcript_32630/g.83364  ORF Transcript_32630/g.83364 Transcript_32630/m.83364 type:complete len:448 (+) Transcript_32630:38-1381(+)
MEHTKKSLPQEGHSMSAARCADGMRKLYISQLDCDHAAPAGGREPKPRHDRKPAQSTYPLRRHGLAVRSLPLCRVLALARPLRGGLACGLAALGVLLGGLGQPALRVQQRAAAALQFHVQRLEVVMRQLLRARHAQLVHRADAAHDGRDACGLVVRRATDHVAPLLQQVPQHRLKQTLILGHHAQAVPHRRERKQPGRMQQRRVAELQRVDGAHGGGPRLCQPGRAALQQRLRRAAFRPALHPFLHRRKQPVQRPEGVVDDHVEAHRLQELHFVLEHLPLVGLQRDAGAQVFRVDVRLFHLARHVYARQHQLYRVVLQQRGTEREALEQLDGGCRHLGRHVQGAPAQLLDFLLVVLMQQQLLLQLHGLPLLRRLSLHLLCPQLFHPLARGAVGGCPLSCQRIGAKNPLAPVRRRLEVHAGRLVLPACLTACLVLDVFLGAEGGGRWC